MNYTTIYELGESGLVSVHKILIRMIITGIDRSIDRSIEDRTRSTNFRVPTSYRNKRPLAAGNNMSLVLPLLLQHR